MVNSWYMVADNDIKDQRQPNQLVPPQPVSIDKLKELGVLYHKIESDDYDKDDKLNQIRESRGYTYSDQITCSKEKLSNYDEKLKMFFMEHIHSDEEIRLCTDGSGYFDVRDKDDRWIRIELEKGDLIILPAGIYHRFTMDENNYIEAKRYFVGEPVWTPINRPADDHEARKIYVKSIEA